MVVVFLLLALISSTVNGHMVRTQHVKDDEHKDCVCYFFKHNFYSKICLRLFGKSFLDGSHFWKKNIHEMGKMCHLQTKLFFPEHPATIAVHAATAVMTTQAPTTVATKGTTSTTTITARPTKSVGITEDIKISNATKLNESRPSNPMVAVLPSIVLVIPPIFMANSNVGMNFTGFS